VSFQTAQRPGRDGLGAVEHLEEGGDGQQLRATAMTSPRLESPV